MDKSINLAVSGDKQEKPNKGEHMHRNSLKAEQRDPPVTINITNWQRNEEGLLIVPPEDQLDIIGQCYDSKIAGY